MFEIFTDADAALFRFRLTAPGGIVVAVSGSFADLAAVVAGIAAVREYAGMAHIVDLTAGPVPGKEAPTGGIASEEAASKKISLAAV